MIKDTNIDLKNIKNMIIIFGNNIMALQEKSTNGRPLVVKFDYINMPPNILRVHWLIVLAVDVMFLNGISFLSLFCEE